MRELPPAGAISGGAAPFSTQGANLLPSVGESVTNLIPWREISLHRVHDAHACGEADAAFHAACTRRSGSLCEP